LYTNFGCKPSTLFEKKILLASFRADTAQRVLRQRKRLPANACPGSAFLQNRSRLKTTLPNDNDLQPRYPTAFGKPRIRLADLGDLALAAKVLKCGSAVENRWDIHRSECVEQPC